MAGDRTERIGRVFEQAIDLPVEQRRGFVIDACTGDEELCAEVESLLLHHDNAPAKFLTPPEAGPAYRLDDNTPKLRVGQRLGRYTLGEVIAQGGMGTIYLAEQDNPRRTVAVKVLHARSASPQAARRFAFESAILAHLHHPHIAQVFEAGTHVDESTGVDGVPYFAMEYVPDATTITEYADRKHLSTRQRLELFVQVCDAVQHGHQKGIIHRDLKPANILVDAAGHLKVIDFGVARATDSDIAITTMRTDVSQIVGTMQYMSPEQCDGDPHTLDTRSDVYSLGVVLYELLTRTLPYDASGTTIYRAIRIIKETEPQKPSTIDPRLRGDIPILVMKALAKDRQRRYQSAVDLARDIRHYLNGEPIEARAPTAWTRGIRWVLRHPIVATTSVCTVIAAITVTATLISLWILRTRPHEVRLSENKLEAKLLSYGGKELGNWKIQTPGQITLAALVERPHEFGGGTLAVVGFENAHSMPHPNSVCAYAVDSDLEEVVWELHVETDDLPRSLVEKGATGAQFNVRYCSGVVDVFPEKPGNEIVVVFHHGTGSDCAIRIYDLRGTLLYQVWHNGPLGPFYWMADAEMLVFTGMNSEATWSDRGYPDAASNYPQIVFAIRPQPDLITMNYIRTEAGDPLGAVWYRCLRPAVDPAKSLNSRVSGSVGGAINPGRNVHFLLFVDSAVDAAVWWVIDEHGNEVPGSRGWNDQYKANMAALPDPSFFDLHRLPPIERSTDRDSPNGD